MQSAVMTQQPIPMVQSVSVVQQRTPTSQIRKSFAHKTIIGFGISQIILGLLVIVFTIVIRNVGCIVVKLVNGGFLTGLFIISTGIAGCVSGYTKRKSPIAGYMLMSIMSAIAAVGALVVYYYGVGAQQRCDLIIYPLITYSCDYERYATCVASYTINLIASFGVAITAIIAACLCGRAICCICIREVQTAVGNSPPPTAMQVQVQPTSGYNYPPQQQPQPTMMMMPQVQITQQTQPQPMFQQQAQDFRQQQSPQHNVVGPPSPPPSYSSTEGNAYVADTQKVPLVQ